MEQGEHGTGRNVAPYVEMEWGSKAYELMWELKEMFDPDYVLNPGVILNKARPALRLSAANLPHVLLHRSVYGAEGAPCCCMCWYQAILALSLCARGV